MQATPIKFLSIAFENILVVSHFLQLISHRNVQLEAAFDLLDPLFAASMVLSSDAPFSGFTLFVRLLCLFSL